MGARTNLWTVVQHSGFGYANNPQFQKGLESRNITTAADKNLVKKAGGVLFDGYLEAEEWAMREMYDRVDVDAGRQHRDGDLIPHAPGEFSRYQVDGLRIYCPLANTVAINDLLDLRAELTEEV